MSNHVVRVAFATRAQAFAFAAELRRRYDDTSDLEVTGRPGGWYVLVPTPVWRSPALPTLLESYRGRPAN